VEAGERRLKRESSYSCSLSPRLIPGFWVKLNIAKRLRRNEKSFDCPLLNFTLKNHADATLYSASRASEARKRVSKRGCRLNCIAQYFAQSRPSPTGCLNQKESRRILDTDGSPQ
jgi:hypothetical protein